MESVLEIVISVDSFIGKSIVIMICLLVFLVSIRFTRLLIEYRRLGGHQALSEELQIVRLRIILQEDIEAERAERRVIERAAAAARQAAEEASAREGLLNSFINFKITFCHWSYC